METISYTAVRAKLAQKMKQVCEDHAPLIITRANAKPVVLLSLEDYETLAETAYLVQSPKNAQRLTESIAEIEASIAEQKPKK